MMQFDDYQSAAAKTAQLDLATPTGRMELVFGLMAEVGSLAQVYKMYLREDVALESQRERLVEDIGDVQWYLTMIARSLDIPLGSIIEANLSRIADRYSSPVDGWRPTFDASYPATERFPRRMLFRIETVPASTADLLPHVALYVEEATPYVFSNAIGHGGKRTGFVLGEAIGDPVNDNAVVEDGYRYHDAVHIAFMAVLGWSPVMRDLLRIKRKSVPDVDRTEDGARARDLEEALSAILKEFSTSRNGFVREIDVDGAVRDVIRQIVKKLEVAEAPIWLWAKAICQGYLAMNSLRQNEGGWVVADLDAQSVSYSRERPVF